MANFLDNAKLTAILKDFYTVTHIRIAILDNNYRDIGGYPRMRAEICSYIRSSAEADKHCRECDRQACLTARQCAGPYMYRCHAGLYEIIEPLSLNGTVVGYLFFAHMFSAPNRAEGEKIILASCKNYGLDQAKLASLIKGSQLLSREYIAASSHLLETIATYLCLERLGVIRYEDNLPIVVNQYILDHLSHDIQIGDICSYAGVGKTKLCAMSNRYFGMGIHEHIRSLRIEKAKEILSADEGVSIEEVAERCGFDDYNYFISIFRKVVGTTPKKFWLEHRGDAISSEQALTPLL
jgi:AraC-like DNA-binding protein